MFTLNLVFYNPLVQIHFCDRDIIPLHSFAKYFCSHNVLIWLVLPNTTEIWEFLSGILIGPILIISN